MNFCMPAGCEMTFLCWTNSISMDGCLQSKSKRQNTFTSVSYCLLEYHEELCEANTQSNDKNLTVFVKFYRLDCSAIHIYFPHQKPEVSYSFWTLEQAHSSFSLGPIIFHYKPLCLLFFTVHCVCLCNNMSLTIPSRDLLSKKLKRITFNLAALQRYQQDKNACVKTVINYVLN